MVDAQQLERLAETGSAMLDRYLAALLDPTCSLCTRRSASPLCRECATTAGRLEKTSSGLLVSSLAAYDSAIGERIQKLKYREETYLATRLGGAMAMMVPAHWRGAALVPVPLHPERLAERGFNQSALLARKISATLRLPLEFDVLRRTKWTEAQAQLSYRDRVENARAAFGATKEARGKTYLLVDDVVTTGKTADACREALEQMGARVLGVVAAATGGGLTHS